MQIPRINSTHRPLGSLCLHEYPDYRATFIHGKGRTIETLFWKNAQPITAETSNCPRTTRIIIIFIVIAPKSDSNHKFSSECQWQNCLFNGSGLSWSVADMQLLGVDMASGKTLYAIHRGRGWPYSSVKQMAGRIGRKRKITKEDRGRSALDEHQASTARQLSW